MNVEEYEAELKRRWYEHESADYVLLLVNYQAALRRRELERRRR